MNSHTPLSRRSLLTGVASLGASLVASRALGFAGGPAKWNDKFEVAVDLEINDPNEGRYHRPYVAVWVEDANGNSIRTLSLWVQTTRRGPRWIPDLRRWFRGEESRREAKGGDLVETISSPTRNPGKYTLVWDGKDDTGKLVTQGKYDICVEAAREHGTYGLLRKTFDFGKTPVKGDLGGNEEIKAASVEYRKRA